MKKIFLSLALLLISISAICQNPLLLKDVYPGVTGSGIQQIVKTSNYTFFNAEDDDPDADRGLYRTDGTPGGTIKLNLTYPTYISTKAEKLTALGDKVVFAGDNFPNYGEIWTSDGTQAGTIAIERFQPTTPNVSPVVELNTMGSYVYYSAVNSSNQAILKRTDGTVAGTSEIYNFSAYAGIPEVVFLTPVNNILYFIVYDASGTGNDHLWRSDGTTAGTYLVFDFTSARFVEGFIMPMGNNFYIMIGNQNGSLRENTLWKSDGTTAGTVPLKLIGTNIPGPNNNIYPPFAAIGSTLYFAGLDGNGKELWKTDGTAAGTVMVADINSGAGSSNPTSLTVLNNNLYFAATGANGNELWKFDGTTATEVKDIYPGTSSSTPIGLVESNGTILFSAANDATGTELWITDGTTANTKLAANINPSGASAPSLLTPGNPVYFSANNGVNGVEIFTYDNSQGISGLHKLYVNDNSTSGDIYTTAVGNNANAGTGAAPVATITYALSIAQVGDTIMVDAGTYTEQVTIDKGITIAGAGRNLTSILKPAVTIPPPGPFTEPGVFQTAQNIGDVHIKDLSVTGDPTGVTPIILQSGGSVKNCNLQNGNQGIFFRVESATKNVLAENNMINAEYIGVNCAGLGLTATLTNNTISVNNPGFSAGLFVGQDFGSLPQFTATGNIITNYSYCGLSVNSLNANITQNSIVGVSGFAIQRTGGNTPAATCNWYGTADAEIIKSKISGVVTYAPWLVNGTDTDPVASGFQPVPGTCTGRQNKFYVNDNSQSGDVFTTAVGNNANNGFSISPFATINYAISVAQAGDTIIVDAGLYAEAVVANKSLYFKGAQAGNCPGSLLTRGSESAIVPPVTNNLAGNLIVVQAANVTIDGFTLDGDNPLLTSSLNMNGANVDGFSGITNNSVANMTVKNNIIKNLNRNGIGLAGAAVSYTISCNHIDNLARIAGVLGIGAEARGINTSSNAYGVVTNNHITRTVTGMIILSFSSTGPIAPLFDNNTVTSYQNGILISGISGTAVPFAISSNTFSTADYAGWTVTGQTNIPVNRNFAINVNNQAINTAFNLTNNNISGAYIGINAQGLSGPLVNVGGGTISNSTEIGIFYNGNVTTPKLKLQNVSLADNVVGMDVSYSGGPSIEMEFSGTAITGGNLGIRYYGSGLSMTGNTLSGISFSNQSQAHIYMTSHAFEGQTIDASGVSFNGIVPTSMTLAQLFATEDKLIHKMDFDSVGYFKLKPTEVFITPNSFAAVPPVFGTATTTPSIKRAIGAASTGDIVRIQAGNYVTEDLILDKAITLSGANELINPNDPANLLLPNSLRNLESIISGSTLTIAADNIAMEGLTFDPGNKSAVVLSNTAATNNNFGNFRFAKNIFKIANTTANLNSFAITGKFVTSPALPVTSGYTIADNRFEKSGNATGNTLNFNYVKDISVADNSFVVTGTTLKTQQAANIAGTGIVDGFIFSNNLVDEASTAFGGNRIAGAVVSGNKIHNAATSFGNTNNMPESSNIEFSNNELSSDLGSPFMLYNRNGVSLAGTSNIFKVENNIITGVSEATSVLLFAAMNFTFSNTALNPSFIIRGNKITYSGDFSSIPSQTFRPITVRGNIANVMLENNELTLNNAGGLGAVAPTTPLPINPAFSIITDNGATSYMPSNAVINILNNKIHGYKQSVVFYDVAATGHDTYTGYGNIPAGAIVNVNNNSFTGDSISINNGTASQSVNATCNWYGSAAAQNVLPKISTATVNYIPWLANGTDNNVATGFQPVTGSCIGIAVTAVVTQSTNINCNGANNGSINVTISGGSTPYTFAWSKDNVAGYSNIEDLSNLAPGVYQLTVTDANGSVATTSPVSITEPAVLTASASGTNVSCFGNSNGTATVAATGGTAPYTYLWSNTATTNTISGLVAGNYTVTVTDANGCTTTAGYLVTQPTLLTVVMTGTNASCNGSATATPAGGTAPYTYSWSNGATTQTISSVPNGTYTVIVTDANNCTVTGTRIINGNSPINPTATVVNVSCFGGTNGIITVTGAGGVAPHTYNINGSAFQPGNVFPNLPAGVYVVGAKDANGCVDFVTRTITQPTLLTVALDSVKAACFGVNNGRIYITAGGGTGTKTYSWTGPNGYTSTAQDPNNLFGGTYNLLVTDTRGCTVGLVVIVVQRPLITISEVITNVDCRGNFTGEINATVTGGSGAGFIYRWNGPGVVNVATEDLTGLRAGNFTLIVTDIENGCALSKVIVITQPAANLGLATTRTNVTGCNNLGTITATGSGGTSPYQYKLDNGSYQSSGSFINLPGATYTVWVQDANGCTTTRVVIITDNGTDQYEGNNTKNQAKVITISTAINARIAIAGDAADWFRFVTPAGTGNFILNLTHPSVAFTFNMYAAGNNTPALVPVNTTATSKEYVLNGNTTYFISVTGGLSYTCYELIVLPPTSFGETITSTSTGNDAIIEKAKPVVIEIPTLLAKAYPNPHQGRFNLQITSPEAGIAKIELFSSNGQKLQERTVSVQKGESNIVPLHVTQHGTIFYRVQIGKYIANGKVNGTN